MNQCLFATRMSNSQNKSAMEHHFFTQACRHLTASSSSNDRLLDGMRAAMLLCTYSYTSGRFHEVGLPPCLDCEMLKPVRDGAWVVRLSGEIRVHGHRSHSCFIQAGPIDRYTPDLVADSEAPTAEGSLSASQNLPAATTGRCDGAG